MNLLLTFRLFALRCTSVSRTGLSSSWSLWRIQADVYLVGTYVLNSR